MTPQQAARVEALQRLLAHGDMFDCWRRSRVTQPGDPQRFALLAVQPRVHRTHQLVARDNERLRG